MGRKRNNERLSEVTARIGRGLPVTGASLEPRDPDDLRGPRSTQFPFSVPAIAAFEQVEFTTPVTFFVGENGSGKSTLLEAIAVEFGLNAEGGTKHVKFASRSSHVGLGDDFRLHKRRLPPTDSYFLRAESFYNLATILENPDDYRAYDIDASGGRSFHEQSHGEAFLGLVLNRFRGDGFYVLDEPESALSPARQLALMAAMKELVDRNSQFLIATHSPILLGYPGATILEFGEHGVRPIRYQDTEHYQITRAFLENPERMLNQLFSDDAE